MLIVNKCNDESLGSDIIQGGGKGGMWHPIPR